MTDCIIVLSSIDSKSDQSDISKSSMDMEVDNVVVEVVECDVGGWVVVDVVVDDEIEDNSARAHCLVDGGLCFEIVRVMGTEIRERFQSQYRFLRDNQMA